MSTRGRLMAAVVSAAATRGYLRLLRASPPGGPARWQQRNYAGRPVSRIAGPAYALGVLTALPLTRTERGTSSAMAVAIGAAAAAGVYDDLAGSESARGFAGHGAALAQGKVTSGMVKLVAISAGGLLAGCTVRRSARDGALAGALIAGTANLINLLDLRPGRATKAALIMGAPALRGAAGPVMTAALVGAAAVLPDDLAQRVMLGDGGACALGAAVGTGLSMSASPRTLRRRLAGVVALTVASEFVSFSRVIDKVAPLRALDRIGRQA